MEVVFLTDVEGVALGGEVKEVKNGFARNYLIPQNLAKNRQINWTGSNRPFKSS
jgi:ribosomal protein L9